LYLPPLFPRLVLHTQETAMRTILVCCLIVFVLTGCGKENDRAQKLGGESLDALAVTIRDHPRSYFFSDRRGAFLVGSAGPGAAGSHEWTVNGEIILHDLGALTIDGKPRVQGGIDSVRVTPCEVVRFLRGGIVESLSPLDQIPGEDAAHGVVVAVETHSPCDIVYAVPPETDLAPAPSRDGRTLLFRKGPGASVAFTAGAQGEVSSDRITLKQTSKAMFVIVYAPSDSADSMVKRTHDQADLLRFARRDRMGKLLQRAYLQTSDDDLTRALRWLQLSLDALTVTSPETGAAASVPWDGSANVLDNAIAIGGMDAATGDYGITGRLLRTLAHHQDASAEGGAWFARAAYEHVLVSGDTALVRELYPDVASRLERSYRLYARPGGSMEADVQALWYFQQTIGSIFASFVRDTVHAVAWGRDAERTLSEFNRMFIDTSRNVLYNRIASNGRGTASIGPGVLLCLDMIESEAVRQNTVKTVMRALLRPEGIATAAGGQGNVQGTDTIQTWMAGQMVYALTRYDCQDISYPVTRRLAERILTTDMVGVLPQMYAASAAGGTQAPVIGAPASLVAVAEFVRSFYQDYLGVHVNMTTGSLALEPKLPDAISDAAFTIFAGAHRVPVRYERSSEKDKVVLDGTELDDSLRVTFLWMMKNGDAWRGATSLHPGRTATLIFGEHEATGFSDQKEAPLESLRHLVGFSQRKEMEMGGRN
jgi:hypothetical protein